MKEEMIKTKLTYRELKEEYEKLQKEFEQYKKESIKYTVDDIINADDDYSISYGEAQMALERMVAEADKYDGIDSNTFADYLFDFGYYIEEDEYTEDYEDEEYQDDDQILM